MIPLRRTHTYLLLLALAACDPHPFIDFTGKVCKAQSDCPEGYACRTGQCTLADAGIPDAGYGCPAQPCPCDQICFVGLGTCGVPRPLPAARYDATVVAGSDGLVYVAGGNGGGFVLKDCWTYDPRSNEWTALANLSVAVAGAAGTFSADGRFWLSGGYNYDAGAQQYLATVQVYDPASNAAGWSRGPQLIDVRGYGGLALVPDETTLIAFGGMDDAGVLGSAETHPHGDGGWKRSTATLSKPREKFASAAGAGVVFAAGGYDGQSMFALEDIDVFRDGGFSLWPQTLTTPRLGAGGAFDPTSAQLYVVGGAYDSPAKTLFGSAEACPVEATPCVLLDGQMAVPRYGLGAAVAGGVLLAFGGRDEKDGGGHDILDSVEAYALTSGCNSWVSSGP